MRFFHHLLNDPCSGDNRKAMTIDDRIATALAYLNGMTYTTLQFICIAAQPQYLKYCLELYSWVTSADGSQQGKKLICQVNVL